MEFRLEVSIVPVDSGRRVSVQIHYGKASYVVGPNTNTIPHSLSTELPPDMLEARLQEPINNCLRRLTQEITPILRDMRAGLVTQPTTTRSKQDG